MLKAEITVEILDGEQVVAQGEIIREFTVQAGYPITVKMGHIADTVIDTIKDDTYE